MDLNKMRAYNDKLEALTAKGDTGYLHDHYSLSIIKNTLLNLGVAKYEVMLQNSLNEFLTNVNAAFEYGQNKNLSLKVINELLELNRLKKEECIMIFAAGTGDFIDTDKLPKHYHLQEEGIIVDKQGNLVFDNDIVLRYAKEIYLPYIEIFKKLVDLTHLALLDVKDAVNSNITNKANEGAAVEPIIIKSETKLSAFEIALRHWYLVENKVENYLVPKKVGEKYGHLANSKNIELNYGKLDKKPKIREAKLVELVNVKKSLREHPSIQKAIENDIDKLS